MRVYPDIHSPKKTKKTYFRGGHTLTHAVVISLATGQCKITIDTTAPDDTASWYDLWQAAVALDGMCARGGRTGKARFLGEFFFFFFSSFFLLFFYTSVGCSAGGWCILYLVFCWRVEVCWFTDAWGVGDNRKLVVEIGKA